MNISILDRLNKWGFPRVEKHRTRRRAGSPKFCGQIERLEARTVLSASIAPWPGDFQLGAIEQRDYSIAQSEAQAHLSQQPISAHYRNGSPSIHWDGGHDPPAQPNDRLTTHDSSHPQGTTVVLAIIIANSELPFGLIPPTNAPVDSAASDSGPLAGTSPSSPPTDSGSPGGRLFAQLPDPTTTPLAGQQLAPISTTTPTTNVATAATEEPVEVRDAVFQEFSSDSLLLAASVAASRDFNSDREDPWPSVDRNQDGYAEIEAGDAYDEVAASLEAFEREREAVDAVLAELHDLEIQNDQPSEDADRENQRADSIADAAAESGRVDAAEDQAIASGDRAEGGMVLLETSGDANVSAYDMKAVFARGIESIVEVPLSVEASVGIYQAFDVGGNEPRPSDNRAASTATPATVDRPNATVKGGTQSHQPPLAAAHQ